MHAAETIRRASGAQHKIGTEDARPLQSVRVLDMTTGDMALVGQYLSDLGADVKFLRSVNPVDHQSNNAGSEGIEFASVIRNSGKNIVDIDLDSNDYCAQLEKYAGNADILIENFAQWSGLKPEIDRMALLAKYPTLVILSISDFGCTGEYSSWVATEPVLQALSGELSRSGIPGAPPLLPPDGLAMRCSAAQAAFVTLLAYLERLERGVGDLLDFSVLDGVVQTLDPGFGIAGSAAAGARAENMPRGRVEARFQYPIIPCSDGHVRICILAPRQWRGMYEWMGRPAEFSDPEYEKVTKRFNCPLLVPAISAFFAGKSATELEHDGQQFGVPIAQVLTSDEAIESEHFEARGVFKTLDIGSSLSLSIPRGLFELDRFRTENSCSIDRREARAVEQEWLSLRDRKEQSQTQSRGDIGRPLAGFRVLDLGVIVVGAETGRLLADAGADVVKVENADFPDGSRQTRDGSSMSPSFAAGHRNKRSLMVNLRSKEGKELFLKLVSESDIVLSNFKPGTLESLGLDHRALIEANPQIISIESSAFGPTGPWSKRLGYGPLVRAATGVTSAWRYSGTADEFSDAITVYPDHVAARMGAMVALALLVRRHRSGRGGSASIAQAEVILNHFSVEIAARRLEKAGRSFESALQDVPWGVFPCAGNDDWCAVTVRGDTDWQRLAEVLGVAGDDTLSTREGRIAQKERVEALIEKWLHSRNAIEAMRQLQSARVPAAAMLRVSEMPDFDYFINRDFFAEISHPLVANPFKVEARPVLSIGLADPLNRPAPLMGEHSVEVLKEWLELSEGEIHGLLDRGVVTQLEQIEAIHVDA